MALVDVALVGVALARVALVGVALVGVALGRCGDLKKPGRLALRRPVVALLRSSSLASALMKLMPPSCSICTRRDSAPGEGWG